MAGISSKAAGVSENKKKYNGIEFENDLEIQTYDAFFRELDPQTARWWQIDPVTDGYESISPYASMYDNPITYSDPLGNEGQACCSWEDIKQSAGTLTGALVGTLDNNLGTNLRGGVSSAISDKPFGKGWNSGLDVADVGSMISGAAEKGGGAAILTTSLAVTGGTGGLSIEVTGPTALMGGTMMLHGQAVQNNGAANFGSQNGRVNTNSNNTSGSNKQKNAPQEKGTPNSSKIEAKDKSGKTTKYSTYGGNGNIKKQVQVDQGTARHGVPGATKKVPNYNTNPKTGETHMNGYKIKKAMPAETPPGRN